MQRRPGAKLQLDVNIWTPLCQVTQFFLVKRREHQYGMSDIFNVYLLFMFKMLHFWENVYVASEQV